MQKYILIVIIVALPNAKAHRPLAAPADSGSVKRMVRSFAPLAAKHDAGDDAVRADNKHAGNARQPSSSASSNARTILGQNSVSAKLVMLLLVCRQITPHKPGVYLRHHRIRGELDNQERLPKAVNAGEQTEYANGQICKSHHLTARKEFIIHWLLQPNISNGTKSPAKDKVPVWVGSAYWRGG